MAYPKSRNPDGRPPNYGESKTRVSMSLTKTCVNALDASAGEIGCSRSELIERVSRSPDCLKLIKAIMNEKISTKNEKKVPASVGQLELIS